MKNWTPQQKAEEQTLLVNYLIERVTGRASGRLENECLFDMPRDKYFIGNLRSSEGTTDGQDTALQRELLSKIAPVAFGADFLLDSNVDQFQLNITLSWACYYRIFPTFDEQRKLLQVETETQTEATLVQSTTLSSDEAEEEGDDKKSNEAEDEAIEAREERQGRKQKQQKDVLCPKFRKIPCQAEGQVLFNRVGEQWQINNVAFAQACTTEMERARQVVVNDPEAIKVSGDVDKQDKISDTALESAENFQAELKTFQTNVIPEWTWNVDEINVVSGPQGNILSIILTNVSPMPNQSSNRESYLFDVTAIFEFDQNIVRPFELELAPRGFRYDRLLWGRGFNCALDKENDNLYRTIHTPLHTQYRYDTQTQPEARFDGLAQDPLPTLREILKAMQAYLVEWDNTEKIYQTRYGSEWAKFQPEFQDDRVQFEAEIDRFSQGLKLIETDPDVMLAFKLTNETFRRTGNHPTKPKISWRLFQIVFVVTQIPGIATLKTSTLAGLAEREMVDIIYFPTGGGKTEAYLGVLVFHCFFDRLRGKTAGVTAWLRFPLRLLTLQQTQRMADVIGMAEIVRREQSDHHLSGAVTGFSVGYFVGASSSPNKLNPLSPGAEDQVTWSKANDPNERDKWKRVVTCPVCRTPTVRVDLDESAVRLIHRCTNPKCAFPDGRIPIYIVDNEIYRYLPSVIVGTIDKLAGLGNQRKFSLILGAVDGFCSKHGYFNGKCSQDECKDEKQWKRGRVPKGLTGPTLFVQDELHLLREGLGTFDSHYETFIQELLKEMGQEGPLKIIASSATIEAFARQVEHLYGRQQAQARVFPGVGPSLQQSFYAQTRDYAQRLFLGIIPHNKTIFNTILELLEYFHAEIQTLNTLSTSIVNPYGGQLQPGSNDWKELIDLYLTSLTYFMATRHLSSIRTDVESHVNSNLESEGYNALSLAELTGSTLTGDVARILEKVERPYEPDSPDAILATSMVSHGVDIDRFNAMIFYGMPRQNAEYIQASSRVGRTHVGLVLMCLHPVRERDQSHYNYFVKFHQFLGQLVEPVAINRWSKFSIERTLPGLFMGVLLQLLANNSGEANPNRYYMVDIIKKKISTGEITPTQFVPLLKEAYRVTQPTLPAEEFFNDEIEQRISQFLDQIIGASPQSTFVSEALYPKPMRSLRDVDEAIDIELDDIGSRWASK